MADDTGHDGLDTTEGVNEGSADSTGEGVAGHRADRTGTDVTGSTATAGRPAAESDPAGPMEMVTGERDDEPATGSGQQQSAGEG